MTLRKKTMATVGGALLVLVSLLYLGSRAILLGSFARLEEESVHQDVERARDAVQNELTDLDRTVLDWSAWDDSCAFMDDANPPFMASNLSDNTLSNLHLNLILLVRPSGQMAFAKAIDLAKRAETPVPVAFERDVSPNDPLLQRGMAPDGVRGVLMLNGSPMLVSARPILTSAGEGPARGTLLMGRNLDEAKLGELSQITHLAMHVCPADAATACPECRPACPSLRSPASVAVRPGSNDTVAGFTLLPDVYGKPALVLRASMPRSIWRHALLSGRYLLAAVVAMGVILGALTLLLVERLVLGPLGSLNRGVARIGAHRDFSARLRAAGSDELGQLARAINGMLTSLEQAHEGLRADEERLRRWFELPLMGIAFIGRDGHWTRVNDKLCEILGYAADELLKTTRPELVHPEDRAAETAEFARVMAGQSDGYSLEQRMLRGDGRSIEVAVSLRCVRRFDGSAEYCVAVLQDVTERKRTEHALRNSEALHRTTTETAQDAIITTDATGHIRFWNRAAEKIFGFASPEVVGRNMLDLIVPPRYREAKRLGLAEFARTGTGPAVGQTAELTALRKGGGEFPIEISMSGFHDREGHHAVALIRDITQRKLAEQALATRLRYEEALAGCSRALLGGTESEDPLTVALQHLLTGADVGRSYIFENVDDPSDGLCMRQTHEVCAPGVRSELGNPQLQRLPYRNGFERWPQTLAAGKPMLGPVSTFADAERAHLEPQGILSLLALPLWVGGKWWGFVGLDDTRAPREWTEENVRLLQAAAEMIGVYLERQQSQQQLRDQAGALRAANWELQAQKEQMQAQQVELRAVNEELEQARQAAEAANVSKSEFLANMSHEIRTPMTAILGFVELVAEGCGRPCEISPNTLKDHTDTIARNARHLLQILNDILDVSKIEAGKLEIESVPFSPLQLLADIDSLMRVRATGKGLQFSVACDGPIPRTVYTDPTRLRQILINLVGNAVKFTETGSVRLVARLVEGAGATGGPPAMESTGFQSHAQHSPAPPAGAMDTWHQPALQFEVTDTGIGMTPDQIARLFHPFTQADSSITRKFGGTGLGLTISRRLAEMLGGTIALDSTPGQGSTFRVTIATGPLDGVELTEDGVRSVRTEPPVDGCREAVRLAGRILVAEDGPDNQRLLSFLLTKAGAEVVVADNGQIAVERALAAQGTDRPFDLILMDMQMPVLDGYAATRRLRQSGYRGPIVALTAHAMPTDCAGCLQAGCDDYASKPIDRANLLALAAKHMRPLSPAGVAQSDDSAGTGS